MVALSVQEDLLKEVKTGLESLDSKIEKYGKDSSETKAVLDKVSENVVKFEEINQKLRNETEQQQKRIELLENFAAKNNAPAVKVNDICALIKNGLLNADMGHNSLYKLATKDYSANNPQEGGVFITEELMGNMLITFMRDSNPMLANCTILTGNSVIRIPRKYINFGSSAAGEKQSGTGRTEAIIKSVTLNSTRYFTKESTTLEFLKAQTFQNESTIAADMMDDLGWKIQFDCLRGDGNSKPYGLLNEDFLLKTAFASNGQSGLPAVPTWTDLLKVKDTFSYAKYRENGTYYMPHAVLTGFLTEKSTTGFPIYLPGINGSAASTIAGRPFVIMPDMDKQLAVNAMPILYGDMKAAYLIMLDGQYVTYRDPNTNMDEGLLVLAIATFAGGSVINEEAIRAIRGV